MDMLKNIVYRNLTKQQLIDISQQTKKVLYDIDGQILKFKILENIFINFNNDKNKYEEIVYFINNSYIIHTLYGFEITYGDIKIKYEQFVYIQNQFYEHNYILNNISINTDTTNNNYNLHVEQSKEYFIENINNINIILSNNNFSYITSFDLLKLIIINVNGDHMEDSLIDFIEGDLDMADFIE